MAKKQESKYKKIASKLSSIRLNYLGLVIAVLFICLSFTPSLMPRPSFYQGLIGGFSAAAGYGIGVLLSKLIRWVFDFTLTDRTRKHAWRALLIGGVCIVLLFFVLADVWQQQVRELLSIDGVEQIYGIRVAVVSLCIFALLIGLGRIIKRLALAISSKLNTWLSPKLSLLTSVILIIVFAIFVFNGVLATLFTDITNSIYSRANNETSAGVTQPTQPERSGSPVSLAQWETLGKQGRSFVGRGPSTDELSAFNGAPSLEPIRVYVGLQTADTVEKRARTVLEELKRTKAFERDIVVIANATGTGWLEPQAVDSLEYMYNGNSAIASMQYSYLPSWISFLVDQQKATETGRALYDEVYSYWVTLPEAKRPKLITYGLSLGSFSGNAAFTSAADIKNSIDGALFVGTPSSTALWSSITNNRDASSPQILPVYQEGVTVRFASNQDQITSNGETWKSPRVLYMQHASDPVVWFDFDLLWSKPDWLSEPRGSDVSPNMNWYPIVTFLQVAVDQFFGVTVPNGHGHNYPDTAVAAWAAIAPPQRWDSSKTERLQAIINNYPNE